MSIAHPFEPFVKKDSFIMILGTFPSIKSFEENFYYGHPKNQFWKLLSSVYHDKEPQNIEEKKAFLTKHNIALWDVVKSCDRKNSLDSNLKNIVPNDIKMLLKNYPSIQKIYLTSKTALKVYERFFKDIDLPYFYLDSPSPAYAKKSFEEKLEGWREVLS